MVILVSVPCGDRVYLNNDAKLWVASASTVSVPCGDRVYLNEEKIICNCSCACVSVPCGDRVYLNTVSGNALFWLARGAVCGANAAPPPAAQFLSLKCPKKPVKSGCGAKFTFSPPDNLQLAHSHIIQPSLVPCTFAHMRCNAQPEIPAMLVLVVYFAGKRCPKHIVCDRNGIVPV